MRVLLLTHQYFPRSVGGTEMLVRGLVRRLRRAEHEVTVLAHVESPGNQTNDFGFRVTEFEGAPLWELHANLACAENPAEAEYSNPLLAELVARAVREIRPDVVHAAHLMKLSGAVLPRLAREGLPVVVTLSDFWPLCLRHTLLRPDGSICESGPDHPQRCLACAQATHGFARPQGPQPEDDEALIAQAREAIGQLAHADSVFRRDVVALAGRLDFLRAALLGAERLIALSDHQRETFIRHGYPAERIEVLHHGIETDDLAGARSFRLGPDFAAPQQRRIVFIGSMAPHKGAHVLLEAARRVPEAAFTLELHGPAGEPAYAAKLRELAAGDRRISLHGAMAPEQVGEVLRGASALAVPAQWVENDPLILKSALWCGVPVAASRLGSLIPWIRPGENGWLVDASDIDAWAAWLKEPAPCPPVPAGGDAVPTADGFAARLMSIYEEIIQSRR